MLRAVSSLCLVVLLAGAALAVGTFETQRVWPISRTVGWLRHPPIGILTTVGEVGAVQNADKNWYRFDCDTEEREEVGDITIDKDASGATPSMVIRRSGVYGIQMSGTFMSSVSIQTRWEIVTFLNATGATPATDQASDPGNRVATLDSLIQTNANRPDMVTTFDEVAADPLDELSVWIRTDDTTNLAQVSCYGWQWRVERLRDI